MIKIKLYTEDPNYQRVQKKISRFLTAHNVKHYWSKGHKGWTITYCIIEEGDDFIETGLHDALLDVATVRHTNNGNSIL